MKNRFSPVLILSVLLLAGGGLYLLAPQQAEKKLPDNVANAPAFDTRPSNGPVLAPPTISWVRQPQQSERGRMNMAFKVEASTPLRSLQVQITPIVKMSGLQVEKDSRDVPTWLLGQKIIQWDGELDLTASPLAGSAVTVEVVATDEDKRISRSSVVSLTLPERVFTHPLARAIYNLRKALRQEPDKRNEALRALATVLQQRNYFEGRELTLLTLRSAAVRIALDRSDEGLRSALDLLWHAASLFEQDQVRVADKIVPEKGGKKN